MKANRLTHDCRTGCNKKRIAAGLTGKTMNYYGLSGKHIGKILYLLFVIMHFSYNIFAQNPGLQGDSLPGAFVLTADAEHRCVCGDGATLQACDTCFDQAHPILKMAYDLGCRNKEIIKGSCWTFANEVYRRTAGPEGKSTIYLKPKSGPYAQSALIRPGDWIYHINYSFRGVDHSALFVCWTDFERRRGLTLSYYGLNRKIPARIEEFDLRNVFGIFRMNEGAGPANGNL